MELFKSGLKTVLGTQNEVSPGQRPEEGAETVNLLTF